MKRKLEKKTEVINRLQELRNIGPAIAERLYSIKIMNPNELKRIGPEKLYERLKRKEGGILDKCVLYQLRGAVLNKVWWKCKENVEERKKGRE